MTFLKKTLASATLALMTSAAHAAPSDIMFILDGSGSMWGQIDGVAKIQTAKETMTKLLDEVPGDARIGLMTYGTNDKLSCTDVSYINQLGADRSSIKSTISDLKPLGKTPIDLSLAMGISNLAQTEPSDVQKSLVLISDGIETCDGDPCLMASTAAASGVAMKVHVVGFDVDSETRNQLECIAEKGGGQYFNASDTEGFKTAMTAVVKVTQEKVAAPEPKPEPVAATSGYVFEDDFDGEALGEHWTMKNPDDQSYIVEEGELLLVSPKKQGFNTPDPTNLLQLNSKMPKGDWDMNLYMKFDAQTGNDQFWFGLYNDVQNYLGIQFWNQGGGCKRLVLRLDRMAKGERTNFENIVAGQNCGHGSDNMSSVLSDQAEKGVVLTLSKRGRNYSATAKVGTKDINEASARTKTTETLTSLRVPGQLAMMIGKWGDAKGEVLSLIDRVEIISVK